MACLEPESDIYQKCALLKHKIDEHVQRME
jgi:hypothetical protein